MRSVRRTEVRKDVVIVSIISVACGFVGERMIVRRCGSGGGLEGVEIGAC